MVNAGPLQKLRWWSTSRAQCCCHGHWRPRSLDAKATLGTAPWICGADSELCAQRRVLPHAVHSDLTADACVSEQPQTSLVRELKMSAIPALLPEPRDAWQSFRPTWAL